MEIVDVQVTPVHVRMEAPLLWSMGVETGTTRTIVELVTDEGIVGIGETYGGATTAAAILAAKDLFIGSDPMEIQRLISRFEVFRVTSEQMAQAATMKYVAAGVEMAVWDLIGKALDKPLYKLWGGDHSFVPFVAYVFYRRERDGIGGEMTPGALSDRYAGMTERYGFEGIKLKTGVLPPDEEVAAVARLREVHGDQIKYLRFDPNQAWSVETSMRMLRKLEPFDVEYVEDPTWDLNGMSLVREGSRIPLATNQAVTRFSDLAPAVRMRSIDVLLVDLYFWGGVSQAQRVASICETFNIGLAVHSDRELGVGTAAGLHFWASTPQVSHHYDSHYHDQVGDVITEPFVFRDGGLQAPDGPGLGVDLDRDRLRHHHELYLQVGDAVEFFDPVERPGWTPHLPLF